MPGIKTAKIIPDDELWLHQEPMKSKLERALVWAAQNEAKPSDLWVLENTVPDTN
jgi:TfoX/Sxy family transcriptional regulator of competence genes